jgi:chemotaxis protein MotB
MMKRIAAEENLNPYIALSDLTINVVFIFVFMIAAILVAGEISREREESRYKKAQVAIQQAITNTPMAARPIVIPSRNDPPGSQRWAFAGRDTRDAPLFKSPTSAGLTLQGQQRFLKFAQVLQKQINNNIFRRIRIEGHTLPPETNEKDNWNLSAQRAATVANLFATQGRIPSNYLAVAARGGQTPFNGSVGKSSDPANDRVEIIIEYNQR